jgi:hypothetical protein
VRLSPALAIQLVQPRPTAPAHPSIQLLILQLASALYAQLCCRSEMLLPRLFKQSETGRHTLRDFVKHKLVKDTTGLIPWVNDFLPQVSQPRQPTHTRMQALCYLLPT